MQFIYKALDKEGKEVRGVIKAYSEDALIKNLQSKGLTILSIDEKTNINFSLLNRISQKQLAFAARQLATLFGAQVSALQTIHTVEKYTKNVSLKKAFKEIASGLQEGMSITDVFKAQQKIFGSFFVSLVNVGYESGTLSESFSYLADYLERNEQINSNVKKALTYPCIVIIVFIVVISLLFSSIVPQLAEVLRGMDAELPLITEIVLAISDFFSQNILLILFGFFGTIIMGVWYVMTVSGKRQLDLLLLDVPLVSTLIKEYYFIRFTESLTILLRGGVPLVQSLDTIEATFGNQVYKEAVSSMIALVKDGHTLASAIETQDVFNKEIIGFIRVGEESGGLANILENVAIFYRQQFNHTIDMMISLIQPLTVIFLGIGVGGVVVSVLLPIYSLTTSF